MLKAKCKQKILTYIGNWPNKLVPCSRWAITKEGYCKAHDPKLKDARQSERRRKERLFNLAVGINMASAKDLHAMGLPTRREWKAGKKFMAAAKKAREEGDWA